MPHAFTQDLCLGFWQQAMDANAVHLPVGATVLEVGCEEANWLTPMSVLRPDLTLVGLDVRAKPGNWYGPHGSVARIKGDVLTYDFAFDFDAVVFISTVEHIGLGFYGDPYDSYGDTHAIHRAASWLKPGGWIYADVPYRPDGPYSAHHQYRAYDPEAYRTRLTPPGCVETWTEVFTPDHRDGPYRASVWTRG